MVLKLFVYLQPVVLALSLMTVRPQHASTTSVAYSADYPATHKALLVSEIAERIARYTLSSADGPHHTCTALALTCKALFDPVMDVAWQKITDFNKLLRCFPADTWLAKSRSKRVVSALSTSVIAEHLLTSFRGC